MILKFEYRILQFNEHICTLYEPVIYMHFKFNEETIYCNFIFLRAYNNFLSKYVSHTQIRRVL